MKILNEVCNFFHFSAKRSASFSFKLPLISDTLLRSLDSIQSDIRLMAVENEMDPNLPNFSYEVSTDNQNVSITTQHPHELLSTFCRVSLITAEDKSRILSSLFDAGKHRDDSNLSTPLLSGNKRN